jgi:hypothetical protein
MQYDISLKPLSKTRTKTDSYLNMYKQTKIFNVTKILKKDSTNFKHVFDIWQVLFTVHTF